VGHLSCPAGPDHHDSYACQTESCRKPGGGEGTDAQPSQKECSRHHQDKNTDSHGGSPGGESLRLFSTCRGSVVPGADVAEPTAPGRTYEHDGGGEENGHEKTAAAKERPRSYQRRDGKMEFSRHQHFLHAQHPKDELGEKDDGKDEPDLWPDLSDQLSVLEFIGEPSGIDAQSQRFPPTCRFQVAFSQEPCRVHSQLNRNHDRGPNEEGQKPWENGIVLWKYFLSTGRVQAQTRGRGKERHTTENEDEPSRVLPGRTSHLAETYQSKNPFESSGQHQDLKSPIHPGSTKEEKKGDAEPKSYQPGFVATGMVRGHQERREDERYVGHRESSCLRKPGP